ncbi:low affinity inorganic phosphate transporter 8-like [Magnolia sinica]|uniref:low affinity inorganic phosphate transporter 8-like n=1 Tax=Magnolia sinica TaxID=86752 RepID=UPI002659A97A|nr:low affinity inorganic phosphate transporter 8-like [Magnolia sinica]
MGLLPEAQKMNVIEVYKISRAMFLVAVFATIPGDWFTVFLIDQIGRFVIQLGGFLMMSIFMAVVGFRYSEVRGNSCDGQSPSGFCDGNIFHFMVFYGLTLFANFGPNSTTFILLAEFFLARLRSTCHGAAARKAGAIISAFVVQRYTILHVDKNDDKINRAIVGLSVVNFIGCLFTFMLPKTNGRSLEEISGEDKDLGGGREENGRNSTAEIYPIVEMV